MNPVVSAVLIIAISISLVTLVLNYGLPLINQQKTELDFQHGKNLVNLLTLAISDLIEKPINSSLQKNISFSDGYLTFSNNTLYFSLGGKTYLRSFQNIKFTNLTIYSGEATLNLTKKSKNFIEIKVK